MPVKSLRMGPEQHVADSSNYSLYLTKLFNSSSSEGHFGGTSNQMVRFVSLLLLLLSLLLINTDSFDPVAQHVLGTRGSRHAAENHAIQQKSEPKTAEVSSISKPRLTGDKTQTEQCAVFVFVEKSQKQRTTHACCAVMYCGVLCCICNKRKKTGQKRKNFTG